MGSIKKTRNFPHIRQIINGPARAASKEYDVFDYIGYMQTGKVYNKDYKADSFQDQARGLKKRHERSISKFNDLRLKKDLLTDKRIDKRRKQIKKLWNSIKRDFNKEKQNEYECST